MELYSEIAKKIKDNKALIAITGGGGKTTLMENLALYLKSKGLSVLITTTTKVESPIYHDYKVDYVYSDESVLSHDVKKQESVFYANKSYDTKKWISPRLEVIIALSKLYDVVLYEADGSRSLPLKIHTERDPVVLNSSDIVIGVMGVWALGHKAYEMCFGDGSGRIIDKSYLDEYLCSEEGLSKSMEKAKEKIFVFNGGENASEHDKYTLASCKKPSNIISYLASARRDEIYATF